MEDIRSLKAIQLDALREVANIGAGHECLLARTSEDHHANVAIILNGSKRLL